MCLDPRPDSLVRIRRAVVRRPAVQSPREPVATQHADDLDARGWTLVTRAVAFCAPNLPRAGETLALQSR